MSLVLGSIHYVMYEKIKFQDKIVEFIMDGDTSKIDDKYPRISTEPLETLIDQENIHGWLSSRIDMVENRLAMAISLADDPSEGFYKFGKINGQDKDFSDIETIFKDLNLCLLDGMPCDRAVEAMTNEDGDLLLITNHNLHDKYLEAYVDPADSLDDTCEGDHDHDDHESFEIGEAGDLALEEANSPYSALRHEFLKGYFEESTYNVEQIGGINFRIYKD